MGQSPVETNIVEELAAIVGASASDDGVAVLGSADADAVKEPAAGEGAAGEPAAAEGGTVGK